MSAVLEMPPHAPAAPSSPALHIRFAAGAAEREAARALRRAVFCGEQGLFDGDDGDDIDAVATVIVAWLADAGAQEGGDGRVVGTVRIHEQASGVWLGSRLAVAPEFRRSASVGSGLIQLAVGAAHAFGCRRFLAHVQSQNVALFERLHWHALGEELLHGRPHRLMRADLAYYPPIADGGRGLLTGSGT